MPLTDTKIRQAKPGLKPIKLTDGAGLYLEVTVRGTKLWRYRYRIDGKENVFAVGEYPAVGLADARRLLDDARALVKRGLHPAKHRREQREAAAGARLNTFKAVAEHWLEMRRKKQHRAPAYLDGIESALRRHVYPEIGGTAMRAVKSSQILRVLHRLDEAGHEAMAIKVRGWVSQVFSFAIIKELAESDPTYPLRHAIERPSTEHARPLSPDELTELGLRLSSYRGRYITAQAIRFLLYAFPRQVEMRGARVCQFDLEAGRWDVPAEIMKMRRPHVVPLSRQVVRILRDLIPEDAKPDDLVFPGMRKTDQLSRTTINAALRYMGYAPKQLTGHDFRATASTHLNEMGYRSDLIERQMAHVERNQSRAAYNHAEYFEERAQMMQRWSDWVDECLAAGSQAA